MLGRATHSTAHEKVRHEGRAVRHFGDHAIRSLRNVIGLARFPVSVLLGIIFWLPVILVLDPRGRWELGSSRQGRSTNPMLKCAHQAQTRGYREFPGSASPRTLLWPCGTNQQWQILILCAPRPFSALNFPSIRIIFGPRKPPIPAGRRRTSWRLAVCGG